MVFNIYPKCRKPLTSVEYFSMKAGAKMDNDTNYIYKKEVDWSLLTDGMSIPLENQVIFARAINQQLKHGESKDIFIYLNGKTYPAKLSNLKFDRQKYPTHKDILQIRYNRTSELAQVLRAIFNGSYQPIKLRRGSHTGKNTYYAY